MTEEKIGQGFHLHIGITQKAVRELIAYTRDPQDASLQQNTRDWENGNGRFSSEAHFSQWVKKGRSVFTLVDDAGHLVGICWFGEESVPEEDTVFTDGFESKAYGVTYAIRLYGSARGAGLAVPFTRAALAAFRQSKHYAKIQYNGIWLETSVSNAPAIAAYTKFGCRQVTEVSVTGRIVMVFPTTV